MIVEGQDAEAVCGRLIALGYAEQNRIRMHGEEFESTSNPFADENGFAVQAISTRLREMKLLRIPLSGCANRCREWATFTSRRCMMG